MKEPQTPDLGRLERVDLREAWRGEATDFTPWLAKPENIELLGGAIGVELEVDGVKLWGEPGSYSADLLNVAADGSLWLLGSPIDPPPGCGGVSHYHGTTWTSYLVESCINDLAIAPDGSVCLGADDFAGRLHTYVITPEAVAATE